MRQLKLWLAALCVEEVCGVGRLAHVHVGTLRGARRLGKAKTRFGEPGSSVEFSLQRTSGLGWYTMPVSLDGNVSHVIVDTASPWLWAYGSQNSSQEANAPRFTINYQAASLGGIVLPESLSFASGEAGAATTSCRAGHALEGDNFWIQQFGAGAQGVMGLACGGADSGSPMDASVAAGAGLEPAVGCAAKAAGAASAWGSETFSLQLRTDGGTLTFGDVPEALLPGLVEMPRMLMCGNWRAPVKVGVRGKGFGRAEAVIDSAAPGIVGLSEHVAAMASALGAKVEVRGEKLVYPVSCANAESLPSLQLVLGEQGHAAHVELPGGDLVVPDPAAGEGKCRLLLGSWDSPQWLLGMPFFRRIRGAVFNVDSRSVSIAP